MIGRTLQNRYLINRLLSKQGGFSDTYIAQDLQLPGYPDCVVKHFKPKFDRDGSRILPDDLLIAKQYFDREADKLMILGRHDRIPSLFAKFEEGGEFFIVMEHINGRPLSLEIGQGERWDEMAVVQLLVDLLSVLAVVHQHPLIHRDIKPDNILRRRSDDQLVLIDFGGVKEVATGEYSQAQLIQDPRSLFLGSKGYIAPEQSIGEARLQSDLYAVGIIALQALTGLPALKLPRDGQGRFIYQSLVQVSDRLQSVLGKLTAPDWRERYSDAAAAWETIQQMFLSSQAPTVRVGSVPPPPPIVPPREGLRTQLKRWLLGDPEPDSALAKPQPRGGSTRVPAPATKEPRPTVIATPQPPRPVDPFAGWRLQEWSFETVRVDRAGRVVKRLQKTARSHLVDLGGGVKLEMVAIPGGQFQMGSLEYDSEKPVHPVTVPPLLMSRYPVTVEQWRRVAGSFPAVLNPKLDADPSYWKDATGPVEQVDWFDAMEFCARLSRATDRLYRLPSEAEWEYACRAGTQTPFAFGETLRTDLANYNGNHTYADGPKGEYRQRTTPVGRFPPNGFGLQDMHGNVCEWCLDDWHENYQGAPIDGRPWFNDQKYEQIFIRQFRESKQMNNETFQNLTNVDNEQFKLLRGGSWDYCPWGCRSAYRYWGGAAYRVGINNLVGFRVVVLP